MKCWDGVGLCARFAADLGNSIIVTERLKFNAGDKMVTVTKIHNKEKLQKERVPINIEV